MKTCSVSKALEVGWGGGGGERSLHDPGKAELSGSSKLLLLPYYLQRSGIQRSPGWVPDPCSGFTSSFPLDL